MWKMGDLYIDQKEQMSGKRGFYTLTNMLFSLETETIIALSISSYSQLDL